MLNLRDKSRIRDEEAYRSKLRLDLETPTTWNGRALAFAQSPFGIWVLSTVVVGLFGWGFAQIESDLSKSRARAALVEHADAEAKSRIDQWVGMSQVRWARREFSWKFQDFYLKLVNSPDNHPAQGGSIYPAYSEFASSALVSVLVQLRENLPAKETTPVDAAISWVRVWNPDVWTGKTFKEAVDTVIEHLWLNRWGSRPVTHEIKLYNITVGGGLDSPLSKFLSAVHPNSSRAVKDKDTDGLFIFNSDDSSGRQRWEIEDDPGGFSRIRLASGINDDGDFLSCTSDGHLADLYNVDDQSSRQRWIIEGVAGDLKHIRILKGVSGGLQYLSASPDGHHLSLAGADDGSGRQQWKIQPIQ
jgi:hypothetical protein